MFFIKTQVFVVVENLFLTCTVAIAIKENLECEQFIVHKV